MIVGNISLVVVVRDLDKYLSDFDSLPFEDVQARYRKKNLFEILNKLSAVERVIEVGCGESSIFEYRRFHTEAIIEPIPEFITRLGGQLSLQGVKIFQALSKIVLLRIPTI